MLIPGRDITENCQESETEVVWTREETRPKIRRKEDSENCTIWKKQKGKTEAVMDGPVKQDMRAISTATCEVCNRIVWSRIVSDATTPELIGSG